MSPIEKAAAPVGEQFARQGGAVLSEAILPDVFREAVAQADVAISITDPAAAILYVNPGFEKVTGFCSAEAIGRNQSLLSAKATPAAVYADMWDKIGAGIPWSGRLVNRRRDGSEYIADLMITPVRDGTGRIGNFLGIHRDVTDLHRLECRVSNQRALIESVVDSAPLAIALLDGDDCVVLDNDQYRRLVGELGLADPARVILDAVRNDSGDFPGPVIGPARDGAPAFAEREIRIDREGGLPPRWFSCSGTWVRSVDEEADAFFGPRDSLYLLLIARDTSAQRAQQEQARMAALQATLAEDNRVSALRESLSAALFHMEGPMNLLASVVALQGRRGQQDPNAAALAEVLRAGQSALATLRQAIPEPTGEIACASNVNELLRDVLDLCTVRLLRAGITVNWKPQAVLPSLRGWPVRLRSLFKALVDNAIDAMDTKGRRVRELCVHTRAAGGSIEILIEDSGSGIPPELRLKAFEPLFTTHSGGHRHAGTGLSMAQQVVADHGGMIEIGSSTSGGCRVRVVLPTRRGEE